MGQLTDAQQRLRKIELLPSYESEAELRWMATVSLDEIDSETLTIALPMLQYDTCPHISIHM